MSDRGDIILDGLLRTVAGLLLAGLVAFEVGAVVVNRVQLDGRTQDAARAGARSLETHDNEALAEAAIGASVAKLPGAEIEEMVFETDTVLLSVSRPAPVLVADRIPFLDEYLEGSATARARIN